MYYTVPTVPVYQGRNINPSDPLTILPFLLATLNLPHTSPSVRHFNTRSTLVCHLKVMKVTQWSYTLGNLEHRSLPGVQEIAASPREVAVSWN